MKKTGNPYSASLSSAEDDSIAKDVDSVPDNAVDYSSFFPAQTVKDTAKAM